MPWALVVTQLYLIGFQILVIILLFTFRYFVTKKSNLKPESAYLRNNGLCKSFHENNLARFCSRKLSNKDQPNNNWDGKNENATQSLARKKSLKFLTQKKYVASRKS